MKTKKLLALLLAFTMLLSLSGIYSAEGIQQNAETETKNEIIIDNEMKTENKQEIEEETENTDTNDLTDDEENTDKQTAPEAIEVICEAKYIYNGSAIVAKDDTFNLKATDQNGQETPVKWSGEAYGAVIDESTGMVTVTADMSPGGTSYWYFTATSTIDENVKKEFTMTAVGYKFSSYDRERTITLSEDGQSIRTTSVSGGVNGYNIWSYDEESTVAEPNSEPQNKTNFFVKGLRPGKFDVSFIVDGNEELTDSTTIQVLGVAVEDEAENRGKTYVGISSENPEPTIQLVAFTEEESSIASWESSNEEIMTVNENGLVTVRAVGSAVISAIDSNGKRGGIKVVSESEDVPYFESLEFLTSALLSGSWSAGETFRPTKLEYSLPIRAASTSSLSIQATTLYDTDKYTAVAEYTDSDGVLKSITVNSGKLTTLPKQPFDDSVMTITIADKSNEENKTVYTFNVSRPRDTSKAIKSNGITLTPSGRSVSSVTYNSVLEGAMLRADEGGNPTGSTGANSSCRFYRTFIYDDIERFKLNLLASTSYAHVRYSTDGGESWTELAQGGGMSREITADEAEMQILVQIIDDATYTNNIKAQIGGFDEGAKSEYKIFIEKVRLSNPKMLTAEASHGDFYPGFDSGVNSYAIVIKNNEKAPKISYTVSEGATVKIGNNIQTPDENGVYTIELKTSQTVINVISDDGKFTNPYKFSYSKKSKHDVADKVVEYVYIGGQYINSGYGIAPHATLSGSVKSLGNFGGYITYYYENPIVDNPNNKYGMDFYVTGNSMETQIDSMAELGQVYVSEDGENWYAIAGSEHYEDKAIWDYTITYTKDENGNAVWTDNYGNSIANTPRVWPSEANYPLSPVPNADTYTFTGILFESQQGSIMGDSTNSSFAASTKFGYPDYYATNITANEVADVNPYVEKPSKANGIDLKWAVDENGIPVDVTEKEFHYVKVATASNIWAGSFFEKSTEVSYLVRTTAQSEAVGVTEAPEGVAITDGAKTRIVSFEEGKTVYDVNLDDMKYITLSVSACSDEDNIYVNNQHLLNGDESKGFKVTNSKETLVRIIVQNGDKEPVLYLLRLNGNAAESDMLIENITLNVSGSIREAESKNGSKYTASVGHKVDEIKILPVVAPGVSYTVNGGEAKESYLLEYGKNEFEISATDENGNSMDAVLVVTREKAPSVSDRSINVTFTLYGDEMHGEDEVHTYIKNKKSLPVWINKTTYSVPVGSTVLDLFEKALKANGLSWVNAGGNYISEINGLAEFDNGALSGWMYIVDGAYSDLGVSEKVLRSGDNVIFHYTDDYTQEESSLEYNKGGSGLQISPSDSNSSDNSKDETTKEDEVGKEEEKTEEKTEDKTEEKEETAEEIKIDFTDILNDSWYYDAVDYVVTNGLMKGMSETEFEPDTVMDRAMLVTVIYRIENEPEAGDISFTDVKSDDYFASAVAWAYENGIVNGVGENEFNPYGEISREQLAAIIYRYASYKKLNITKTSKLSKFDDEKAISEWAVPAMEWSYATGLIKGVSERKLSPESSATRAQVAQILMRFLKAE